MPLASPAFVLADLALSGDATFAWLLRTSWQAAVLVALVGAAHLLFARRLAPRWRFALWGIVVVRLLLPATPPSRWSVFNFALPDATPSTPVAQAPDAPAQASQYATETVRVVLGPVDDARQPDAPVLGSDPPEEAAAPPRRAATSSPSAALDWRRLVLAAWLAGAAFVAGRVALGACLLQRRLRRATPPAAEILALLDRCRREMGVTAGVPALVTDAVRGPALFGYVRPRLLLPPALLRELSADDLRFVFLHELAHVKRGDALTNVALLLAGALHWFNPLARLAVARCRAERELACDELVMDATAPAARRSYGRAVLRVAESLLSARRAGGPAGAAADLLSGGAPAVGMIHAHSQLRRRIAMIATFPDAPRRRRRPVLPVLLVLGVCSCALTDRQAASDRPAPAAAGAAPISDAAPANEPTVAELTRTSRALVEEKRFAEALAVVDQILARDAADEYAVGIRPLLADRVAVAEQRGKAAASRAEGALVGGAANPGTTPPVPRAEGAPDDDGNAAAFDPFAEADTPQARAIQAQLGRNLPEVTFDKVGLSDVIDFLRDVTNANIVVDWAAIEAAGVDRKAPVTVRVREVSFEQALRLVLDQAGGQHAKLDFAVEGAVLKLSTREAIQANVITHVYDVSDLLLEIPDVDDAPRLGVAGRAGGPDDARTDAERKAAADAADKADAERARNWREESLERIMSAITETVDPSSWRDKGGSVGSLHKLQGRLVVTQTRENQRAVARLIGQLREGQGIQVTVEARFVSFDPGKLGAGLPEKLRQTFDSGGEASTLSLNDEEVNAVLRVAQDHPKSQIVTAPRVTLFNGQRAYVLVGEESPYVSGYTVVKTAAGETRYEPRMSAAQSGVIFDVRATVAADRKHVRLDLRPQLTTLHGMEAVPYAGAADAPKDLMVQVPMLGMHSIDTTVVVPDRTTLILGGLHVGGDAAADAPAAAKGDGGGAAAAGADGGDKAPPARQMFILVKPTLIIPGGAPGPAAPEPGDKEPAAEAPAREPAGDDNDGDKGDDEGAELKVEVR